MCKAIEEMLAETKMRIRIEVALNIINDGKLSLEEIASITKLPLEKVKELAPEKNA